jgi:hypothetical protein
MAKKFFYMCGGILLLALSYHFGASSAKAQAPGNSVVAGFGFVAGPYSTAALTANGDMYLYNLTSGGWTYSSNVFGGGPPTPTHVESFGSVKARYR